MFIQIVVSVVGVAIIVGFTTATALGLFEAYLYVTKELRKLNDRR